MDTPYLLTVDEVCEMARCSKKFVAKHRATGRMPGVVRIGKKCLYDAETIKRRLRNGCLLLED